MHFQLTTVAAFSLFSLISAAPTVDRRIPIIGGFTVSTYPTCPYPSTGSPTTPPSVSTRINVPFGSACGKCEVLSGAPYTIITDTYIDSKCTVTLFTKDDCSGDGMVTGPTCWTPEGGIRAYKVACPWWPENPPSGWLKPCSAPTTPGGPTDPGCPKI